MSKAKPGYEELEKYEKRRKTWLWIGILFLVLAAFFTVLAFVLKKYAALFGVVMQLCAGIILIANSLE